MATYYALLYSADVEGDWLREPVTRVLYRSEAAARAAWTRAYRGPDEEGNEARPDIVPVDLGLAPERGPGRVYVVGWGYVPIEGVAETEG